MKRFLSIILVSGLAFFSFSSEDPLEKIIAGFKKYVEELPQEKVYLHLDKNYYSTGETIWFKAYLVAGAFHEPSPFSFTIYVELLDEEKKLIKQFKLLASKGSVSGDINIPESIPSGNYIVRAYTNWMRNFEEEYFFHKTIKVWNLSNQTSILSQEKNLDLQFFPEGGDLIAGLKSKIAFKVTGPDGLGRKIKGKIINQNSLEIAEFQSNFLGMGLFHLTPEKGSTYKAIIEDPKLEISILNKTLDSGLILSVTNLPNQSDVIARIQTTDFAQQKSIYLFAQTRGLVCYAVKINLSANLVIAKIPKSKLPTGVVQLTAIDLNGIPLAERLIFNDENKGLVVEVKPDKSYYKPREKINLSILVKDANGNPVASDLSMAVCDDQQIQLDENRESIYSYLYLTSELRGHIESPGYYFNSENTDRQEDLDLLLMTQGWRRFTFKKAMESQWSSPEFKIEQGLTIRGKLVDKFNNKPIQDGKVTYLALSPTPETKTVQTNATGDFEMAHIVYFDSAQTVLQGETKKGSRLVKFLIDTSFNYSPPQFPFYQLQGNMNEFERGLLAKSIERKKIDEAYNLSEKTIVLDEVEIVGKREEQASNITKMYGNGSTSVSVAGNPGLENLLHPLQLLQGRVSGVQVTGSGLSWNVTIRGVGSMNGNTPLILVNNIQVQIDYLSQIPVRDIESYDVWKGPDAAVFGSEGANGVIAFYTKKGKSYFPPREGIFRFGEIGFVAGREFYSPKYDVQRPEHIKPDRRVTLYWAPTIRTDSTGQASVSFYNHDLETTVTGVIEGLSSFGIPGKSIFKYSIKND